MTHSKDTSAYTDIDQSDKPENWVMLMRLFSKIPDVIRVRDTMNDWIIKANPKIILDAGCGPGDSTILLSNRLSSDCQIIGLDLSQNMIDFANTNNAAANIIYQTGEITHLPFADDSIDIIRIERVIHHCIDAKACLSEFYRVLKPGGKLIIAEPDLSSTRFQPVPLKLSQQAASSISDSNSNGSVGAELISLGHEVGLTCSNHFVLCIIWNDYKQIDNYTHYIETLRTCISQDALAESLLENLDEAVDDHTFFLAMPMHVYELTK